MNPTAPAQPQPEDAKPADFMPAAGEDPADGGPVEAEESPAPAPPVDPEDDEYEPIWQGFGRTT